MLFYMRSTSISCREEKAQKILVRKLLAPEQLILRGLFLEQQAGVVKAAKNALMSEATDFICQFKKLQANSLAHGLENSEDDAENCV